MLSRDNPDLKKASNPMDNKPAGREIQVYRAQPSPVAPMNKTTESVVFQRRLRDLGASFCGWLGTSKPTEWVVVIATIAGAYLYVRSGVLDSRRAALDVAIGLLRIEENGLKVRVAALKQEKNELQNTKEGLSKAISAAEARSEAAKSELVEVKQQSASAKAVAVSAEDDVDRYKEEVITVLNNVATIGVFEETLNHKDAQLVVFKKPAGDREMYGDLLKAAMHDPQSQESKDRAKAALREKVVKYLPTREIRIKPAVDVGGCYQVIPQKFAPIIIDLDKRQFKPPGEIPVMAHEVA